ncbi:MAG: type II toxin-antitoxin system HicA family toxin [Deltaproteobacteria bacterium]|nr:type II toxin-antitoxin system HicA family toxin [Deltaproteobacteria bacterium]
MTPRLPALKPHEVLRALRRAGFFVHHTSGSHYILKHPDRPTFRVTFAPAIANAVFDAAGVRIKDLPITSEKIFLALEKGSREKS